MTASARRRLPRPRLGALREFSLRRTLASLSPSPRLRRRLAVALLVVGLLAGLYFAWFRDSGLVGVDEVTVTGATGRDAAQIDAALRDAGKQMTTLHVDHTRLDRVAAAFPTVRALEIDSDFPSGLHIRVLERRPVALLVAGSRRVPIAGDGSILTGVAAPRGLPEVQARGTVPEKRLGPGPARDAARVAAAAPPALLKRVTGIETEHKRGIVVSLTDDGPDIVFGDTTRLVAKWTAATRILADADSAGADYIDLTVPGRPVAGGLPVDTVSPLAPADSQDSAAGIDQAAPPATGVTTTETPAAPTAEAPTTSETPTATTPAAPETAATSTPQTPATAPSTGATNPQP